MVNAAEANSFGLELEAEAAVSESVTLSAALGVINAEFDSYTDNVLRNSADDLSDSLGSSAADYEFGGNDINFVPEYTANLAARIELPWDLYSNIEFKNNFSMFMKYGAEFELYFLLNKKNRWIKLGKTMPNHGLKLDDHTSFIRGGNSSNSYIYSGSVDEGLIFDYASTYKDPVLVEVGSKINKNISFTSSISTGIVDEDEENITLSAIYKNKMNFGSILLGASIMQENEFSMVGIFGGFSKGNLTLSYEVDKVNNWIIDYESLASYLEMVYKPIQGVHMVAKYDYFDKNYDLLDGSVGRYSFGFNFFPSSLIEIKFQLRDYKLYSIDFDTDREYLVQLHTWF